MIDQALVDAAIASEEKYSRAVCELVSELDDSDYHEVRLMLLHIKAPSGKHVQVQVLVTECNDDFLADGQMMTFVQSSL